jgi:hypothetical protein
VYQGAIGDTTLNLSTVNLDSLGDPASPKNGELAPTFSDPDHFSGFVLYDTLFEDVILVGALELNTPDFTDVNDNGFDDFFEVSEAGSGTSTGTYSSFAGTGQLRATWSRAAGSKDGTYTIEFGSGQTSLGTYRGAFEILEYTGPLSYTADSNKVSGAVNLIQTGAADNLLAGPIEFTKVSSNRFNELTLRHEVWTNASSQTFNISNDVPSFLRDLSLKTNYFGFVEFDDGDPNTAEPDYSIWLMSIDDVNDSNGNGIPDFSDDPGPVVDRLPLLSLSLSSTNLLLSIRPGIGNVYEIQRIDSLSQANWTVVLSQLTVTNDPQTVVLPLPTNAASYWRARSL